MTAVPLIARNSLLSPSDGGVGRRRCQVMVRSKLTTSSGVLHQLVLSLKVEISSRGPAAVHSLAVMFSWELICLPGRE